MEKESSARSEKGEGVAADHFVACMRPRSSSCVMEVPISSTVWDFDPLVF